MLADLAREFGVCTRWFCSVPGETWPNRNFAHAATSDGAVNIEIGLYDDRTIFEQLEEAGQDWRIYCDGRAHLFAFAPLLTLGRLARWRGIDQFEADVAAGNLPSYTFIEPDYTNGGSNSQHPGNNRVGASGGTDFRRGEALIARVYEALRANPEIFNETVLVITYDEHGGFFDHVPPRRVPAPRRLRREDEGKRSVLDALRLAVSWFFDRSGNFAFTTTGVRVPAVIVSPWIQQGRIDDTPYDHTSIIATVRELFAPRLPALTARDKRAKSFLHLLRERSTPRSAPDLPDLSDQTAVAETVTPQTAAPRGRSDAAEPNVAEPNEFHQQLDAIAVRVRDRINELERQQRARTSRGLSAEGAVDELDRFRATVGLDRQ